MKVSQPLIVTSGPLSLTMWWDGGGWFVDEEDDQRKDLADGPLSGSSSSLLSSTRYVLLCFSAWRLHESGSI